MDIVSLTQQIGAVCPIDGVSIGRAADKTTWRVDYRLDATDAQKAAAQAVVAAFSVDSAPPQAVLSQDLMAQFTVTDYAAIKVAVAGSDQFGLLWASLQAQRDPMQVTNARFKSGWSALISVLGQPRMDAIATALGVTVTLP